MRGRDAGRFANVRIVAAAPAKTIAGPAYALFQRPSAWSGGTNGLGDLAELARPVASGPDAGLEMALTDADLGSTEATGAVGTVSSALSPAPGVSSSVTGATKR